MDPGGTIRRTNPTELSGKSLSKGIRMESTGTLKVRIREAVARKRMKIVIWTGR